MSRAEVERVIRDSYAARRDEDVEAVLGFFTKDATFRISINERLGEYGRTIRGHEELRQFFVQLFRTWDWREFHFESVVIDESGRQIRAAVHSTGTMRHAPSGREFRFETLDLLSFSDGRIASFLEFFDTDLLAQFIGEQVAARG
jgi:ketosteroid isomerase-like protein